MIDLMKNEILKRTEKGALGYATSGSHLLDMNFKIPSYRKDKEGLKSDFLSALYEDPEAAILWLFYARDIRGNGAGERDLFRSMIPYVFKYLHYDKEVSEDKLEELVTLIPEYGRWDDLLALIDYEDSQEIVLRVIAKQFQKDLEDMKQGKPISLMAKWLPSSNASSKETRRKAGIIWNAFGIPRKHYRRIVVQMRKYIDVLEQKTSAREWDKTDYSKVPSRANLRYRKAFQEKDTVRYEAYLKDVEEGKAKINAGTLFPHEIAYKYKDDRWHTSVREYDQALEALWKALSGDGADVMVVQDSSGSMTWSLNGSKINALTIAQALAIFFAERCHGPYKDKFITFSENPKYMDLTPYKTFRDKLKYVNDYSEVANTNIEKVFDLVLRTALVHGLKQEDLPKTILILSDMEFDEAQGYRSHALEEALFSGLTERFKAHGYKMPKLAFWNLNSRTNTIPLQKNENGLVLLGGFSQKMVEMVKSDKLDPLEALLEEIYSARYLPVLECIRK